MSVKFLTDEWAAAAQQALDADEAFTAAIGKNAARLQQVVNTPEGEKKYSFVLVDGRVAVAMGEIEKPDAVITQDYATAEAISKNEMSGVAAYMSGKLRVNGDLMKLMTLQGVLTQLPNALKDLDVEY
jgi:putative sterol carrier protein